MDRECERAPGCQFPPNNGPLFVLSHSQAHDSVNNRTHRNKILLQAESAKRAPACSNRHRSRINTRAAHPRPKGSRSGRQSVPRRVRPSPPSHSFQGSSQIAPRPLHRENCGRRCREPAFRSPGWACVAILARSTSCCPITRGIEWSSGNGYGVGRVQRRQVPRR